MRPFLLCLSLLIPSALAAQEADPNPPPAAAAPEAPMTLDRLNTIILALDPEAQSDGRVWPMSIDEVTVLVVTDETADRMRALTPVREAKDLDAKEITRMMQANFDTALDARYAIARGLLWSTYIHPLSPLEKAQFISGLGQVVNLAQSYGTLYSGGALQYRGGDSGALQRELIDDLLKKGEDI